MKKQVVVLFFFLAMAIIVSCKRQGPREIFVTQELKNAVGKIIPIADFLPGSKWKDVLILSAFEHLQQYEDKTIGMKTEDLKELKQFLKEQRTAIIFFDHQAKVFGYKVVKDCLRFSFRADQSRFHSREAKFFVSKSHDCFHLKKLH